MSTNIDEVRGQKKGPASFHTALFGLPCCGHVTSPAVARLTSKGWEPREHPRAAPECKRHAFLGSRDDTKARESLKKRRLRSCHTSNKQPGTPQQQLHILYSVDRKL